jgi:hypothetical protein
MLGKLILAPMLVCGSLAVGLHEASAMPLGAGSVAGESSSSIDTMVHKAWHSGMPHRRIVGDTVYGGRCPPQGCPAWSQRDLRQDPNSGEWYSPRNEAQRERQRYNNPRRGQRGYYNPY